MEIIQKIFILLYFFKAILAEIAQEQILLKNKFFFKRQLLSEDPAQIFKKELIVSDQKYPFYINKRMIFYTELFQTLKPYNYVQAAIEFQDLFSPEIDNMEDNSCCARVTLYQNYKENSCENNNTYKKVKSFDMQKFCLKLNSEKEIWTICSDDYELLLKWKETIVDLVGQKITKIKGNILKNNICDIEPSWNFYNDDIWGCVCKFGKKQSPIPLSRSNSEKYLFTSVILGYIPIESVTITFENGIGTVYGNFGLMAHGFNHSYRFFTAYKLEFRFPSEHSIEGIKADAEILIYHKTEDGLIGIVSFLIIGNNEEDPNEFIEKLNPEFWPPGISKNPYIIKSGKGFLAESETLDLNKLMKGSYEKSFYWYVGSLTTPNCEQGVHHFVMEKPIKTNAIQLNAFKKYSFDHTIRQSGNNRKIQKVNNRKIYYHKSNCISLDKDDSSIMTYYYNSCYEY